MEVHIKALESVEHAVPDDKKYLIEEATKEVSSMKPGVQKDPYLPGFRTGPMVNVESIKYVNNEWVPGKEDILVATFPKTGKLLAVCFLIHTIHHP